jgi:hypothetical protein
VAVQLHSHALGDAGAHHVPNGGAAEIVNDDPGQVRLLARRFPSLSEITDRLGAGERGRTNWVKNFTLTF